MLRECACGLNGTTAWQSNYLPTARSLQHLALTRAKNIERQASLMAVHSGMRSGSTALTRWLSTVASLAVWRHARLTVSAPSAWWIGSYRGGAWTRCLLMRSRC